MRMSRCGGVDRAWCRKHRRPGDQHARHGWEAGCREFAEAVAPTSSSREQQREPLGLTKPGAPHLAGTRRDTFGTQRDLVVDGRRLRYHDIAGIAPPTLPVSLRILLENVLRFDDGSGRRARPGPAIVDGADTAVDLYPSRVFLHDTNGVPTLVDIAALRDGMAALGGDPARSIPSSARSWWSTTPSSPTSSARRKPWPQR